MSSFWMPKKQPLYAPMLASFGGGSSRGWGRGARSGGVSLPVESVFSVQTYSGNGGSKTVTMTHPLSTGTDGGMVLSKSRSTGASYANNHINDSVRGITKVLFTDLTSGESTYPGAMTNLSNGTYQLSDITYNQSSINYLSYVFKRNERFFDIVTYSGNSSSQTISHSLNSEVGMIWVKRRDTSDGWCVYHRGLGESAEMFLDRPSSASYGVNTWSNTAPTNTNFTVGPQSHVNASGGQYVAYLFAHEPGPSGVIACGIFNNGTTSVDLGFEPQFVMFKSTTDTGSRTGQWRYTDKARGGLVPGDDAYLMFDENASEQKSAFGTMVDATSTGFNVTSQGDYGASTIYMAIRDV